MKKRIIFLCCIFILIISLCSCARLKKCSCKKNNDLTGLDTLINHIYDSETKLVGSIETAIINDNDMVVYEKVTNLKLQRDISVKSEVNIIEKKLSNKGTTIYDESVENYTTVDNVKYSVVDGVTYENEFIVPTYYLTFVLDKTFLQEGYTLEEDGNNFKLVAKVYDNKISSLFLNKSLDNLTNLEIEIVITDSKLVSFKATYITVNGMNASITNTYSY